jgi:hypothetical protein
LAILKKRKEVKEIPTWWPMEGKGEGSYTRKPMEGERKGSFSPFPIFPKQFYLKLHFFPLILRFYFTMVPGHYLHLSSLFLGL